MFARTMGGIPSGVFLSHVMLHWHGSMELHETVDFHAKMGVHGIPDTVCRRSESVASQEMKVEVNR